jgi:hypothetical protein
MTIGLDAVSLILVAPIGILALVCLPFDCPVFCLGMATVNGPSKKIAQGPIEAIPE